MNQQNKAAIEWAPFSVKEGVTEEAVLNAAHHVEEGFLKSQPGYVQRALVRGSDHQWVDIVTWESMESASQAAAKANESPVCFEYFSLMNMDENASVSPVKHFEVMGQWG